MIIFQLYYTEYFYPTLTLQCSKCLILFRNLVLFWCFFRVLVSKSPYFSLILFTICLTLSTQVTDSEQTSHRSICNVTRYCRLWCTHRESKYEVIESELLVTETRRTCNSGSWWKKLQVWWKKLQVWWKKLQIWWKNVNTPAWECPANLKYPNICETSAMFTLNLTHQKVLQFSSVSFI